MSNRYSIKAQAREDLTKQAEYFELVSDARLSDRFLTAAETTFEFLGEFPGIGSFHETPHPELQNIRRWPIKGFPNHIIYYQEIPEGIVVLHVFHGARNVDPLLMKNRLETDQEN